MPTLCRLAVVSAFVAIAATPVRAVVINFEGLTSGVQQGDALSASGVTFTTGDIPDAIAVGTVFTFTNQVDEFQIVSRANAPSPPNFAVARDAGTKDLLIAFATPVTMVSLTSDNSDEEASDIIRLLALAATGNPDEFRVLAFAEGLDNAVSSPANLLSVDAGGLPFSFAIFQLTTEREGFDDLTFEPVPEPSTWLLLLTGAAGVGFATWRNKIGHRDRLRRGVLASDLPG